MGFREKEIEQTVEVLDLTLLVEVKTKEDLKEGQEEGVRPRYIKACGEEFWVPRMKSLLMTSQGR